MGGCSSGLGIQSISKKGTAVRRVCGSGLHLLGSQEVETGQDVNIDSLFNSRLALLDSTSQRVHNIPQKHSLGT